MSVSVLPSQVGLVFLFPNSITASSHTLMSAMSSLLLCSWVIRYILFCINLSGLNPKSKNILALSCNQALYHFLMWFWCTGGEIYLSWDRIGYLGLSVGLLNHVGQCETACFLCMSKIPESTVKFVSVSVHAYDRGISEWKHLVLCHRTNWTLVSVSCYC